MGFDEKFMLALASHGTTRTFPKNAVILQEGDESNQIYVVLDGKLKVYLADADGKEIVLDTLKFPGMFGEMALDGSPRSASVMTIEPARLAIIQHDVFKSFLANNADAAFALIQTLIQRARHLTRIVGNLGLLDVYGRVARLLLEAAREENGVPTIVDKLTQQDIAKRVGASRETVARIMSDLRHGGYISVEKDRIVICNALPNRW